MSLGIPWVSIRPTTHDRVLRMDPATKWAGS